MVEQLLLCNVSQCTISKWSLGFFSGLALFWILSLLPQTLGKDLDRCLRKRILCPSKFSLGMSLLCPLYPLLSNSWIKYLVSNR